MFLINPGDLFDKMTILIIKLEKVTSFKNKYIITEELNGLFTYIDSVVQLTSLTNYGVGLLPEYINKLFMLNRIQWDLEDRVRIEKTWDAAKAARENNTKRVEVKNLINKLFNFPIEIKEYKND